VAHCASLVQPVAQLALVPLHAYPRQVGVPGCETGARAHAPLTAPDQPSAAPLHASHAPPQALSQQKPSMQFPLPQTRQPADLQSEPAAWLQVEPWALRGWQVAPAAQKWVDAQSASLAHEVGQTPDEPLQT